jgi:hypothetical protein
LAGSLPVVKYFEIKRLDVERIDIERSEGTMPDRHLHLIAAAPWEVEAERRREMLDADARRFDVSERAGEIESGSDSGRLWSLLRGSFDRAPATGKLDRKHI